MATLVRHNRVHATASCFYTLHLMQTYRTRFALPRRHVPRVRYSPRATCLLCLFPECSRSDLPRVSAFFVTCLCFALSRDCFALKCSRCNGFDILALFNLPSAIHIIVKSASVWISHCWLYLYTEIYDFLDHQPNFTMDFWVRQPNLV